MTRMGNLVRWAIVPSILLVVACSGNTGGSPAPAGPTSVEPSDAVLSNSKQALPPDGSSSETASPVLAEIAKLKSQMSDADFDPVAQAAVLGPDVKTIFQFVRDQIRYEAYSGVLRGAAGTLEARAGNGFDRSLLLSRLLAAAKVPNRFATCELSLIRGEELYRHIFDGGKNTEPVTWPDDGPNGFLMRVVARARRDYPVIRTAVDRNLPAPATQARAQAIKDARLHAWVQASIEGKWIDLDTAFGGAELGKSFCSAHQTVAEMPAESYQQVSIRVTAERLEEGVLEVESKLALVIPAVDLIDETVFLVHLPSKSGGMGLGSGSAAANPGLWTPALIVGKDVKTGQAIDFDDGDSGTGVMDALGGGGSTSAFVSEWIEFEVLRPDGRKDVTRRALIDRASAVWRAAAAHDADGLRPIERNAKGTLGPQAIHNLLFSAGAHDLTAIADAISWVAKYGEPNTDAPIDSKLFPFAVRNFAALLWADHFIIPALNDVAQVKFYSDSPRILIVSAVPDGNGGVTELYDLRRDRLCGLASGKAAEMVIAERKLWFAALEGALEHEAVARDAQILGGNPSQVLSTSSLLGPDGAVMLGSMDSGRLGAFSKDADKIAQLSVVLANKSLVVIPRSALGSGPLGFWEIGPDGDARAVLGEDLNMASFGLPNRGTHGLPRSPSTGGIRYSSGSPPGLKRGAINLASWSRGEEYLALLSISQLVVVDVGLYGTILSGYLLDRTQAELAAWKAAADKKQNDALRRAQGG